MEKVLFQDRVAVIVDQSQEAVDLLNPTLQIDTIFAALMVTKTVRRSTAKFAKIALMNLAHKGTGEAQ